MRATDAQICFSNSPYVNSWLVTWASRVSAWISYCGGELYVTRHEYISQLRSKYSCFCIHKLYITVLSMGFYSHVLQMHAKKRRRIYLWNPGMSFILIYFTEFIFFISNGMPLYRWSKSWQKWLLRIYFMKWRSKIINRYVTRNISWVGNWYLHKKLFQC